MSFSRLQRDYVVPINVDLEEDDDGAASPHAIGNALMGQMDSPPQDIDATLLASPQDTEEEDLPLGVLPPRPSTPLPAFAAATSSPTTTEADDDSKTTTKRRSPKKLPHAPRRQRKSGAKQPQHQINANIRRRCIKLRNRLRTGAKVLEQMRLYARSVEDILEELRGTARDLFVCAGGTDAVFNQDK